MFGVIWLCQYTTYMLPTSSVDGYTCSSKFAWVMKQLSNFHCVLYVTGFVHSVFSYHCEQCHVCCIGGAIYANFCMLYWGCNLCNLCKLLFTHTNMFVWIQPHPWHSPLMLHVYSECQVSHTMQGWEVYLDYRKALYTTICKKKNVYCFFNKDPCHVKCSTHELSV